MRRAVLPTAAAVLLVGPTVLAFFSGGYFDKPRLIATVVVWSLVLIVALASPRPLPVSRQGRVALAGLILIAAWTGLSLAWAPLAGPATDNLARLLLYVGAFLASVALLRDRLAAGAVEPLLALGAVVVIGYGLSGRMLPGVIDMVQSVKAGARLEQPITYWNAEGLLAAMGLVLCARLAGTASRPTAVRLGAAAASAPLGLGIYLSYSRGAIPAALVGSIVLVAAAPSWTQLRGAGIGLAAGLVAAAGAAALPGVASLDGSLGERERDGALMLGILVAVMLAAALLQARTATAERRGRAPLGELPRARPLAAVATVAVAVALAGLVIGGLGERARPDRISGREGAPRLTSVESRRYDYWRIGLSAFARHPLNGLGAGGFRVVWVRERPVAEGALEVHSLPLEMAAELGLPGLLGLGLFVGGVGMAGGRALRRGSALAPGLCAAATVWLLHATIDWHWQVPAVTLPALIMAGALVAANEAEAHRAAPLGSGRGRPEERPVPAAAPV